MTVCPGPTGAASCVRAPFQMTVPADAPAVAHDAPPGGIDPVVAEVDRTAPVAAGKVLDPDRDARGHERRERRRRLREHRRSELERFDRRDDHGLVEGPDTLAAEPGDA